jgi:methionyl-tRNA formyltransferase
MRIVFMGTPEFAVPTLRGLVHAGHEVVTVYTQPDKPQGRGRGLAFSAVKAAALDIGLTVHQPSSLTDEVDRIAQLDPEVIIVAAFAQLLPKSILGIPPAGCLNVHPSLLPRHRGASPVDAAILAGDEFSGVSIMLMDEGWDTGAILARERMAIGPEDTTGTLTEKLADVGARLLVQTLPEWVGGNLTPQPQSGERANYTPKITKQDGDIDWNLPAVDIWRRVRAFQPWPGCYTQWRGRLLKIIEAAPSVETQLGDIGQVVMMEQPQGGSIGVQTGAGVLQLVKVQPEGKKTMAAEEFARGQRDFVGSLLPG